VNLDGHVTWSNPEGRLTISVPEAGRWLSLGRDAAYAAAARGEIPTLRLGRRIVVPVPKLLQLLGATPDMSADPATTTGPNTTTEPVERAFTHDKPLRFA
jgi:hypothetical protein